MNEIAEWDAWGSWHPDDSVPEWFDLGRAEWLRLFWCGFWECVFGHDYGGHGLDHGAMDLGEIALMGLGVPRGGAYQDGWDSGCGMFWDAEARDRFRAAVLARGGRKWWEDNE